MGGREGLVDTAVKTADTGYMQRRLMVALEDLSSQYDGTVRNAEGHVVQLRYGDDGLNPSFMEEGDRPVNFPRLLTQISANHRFEEESAMTAEELRAFSRSVVGTRQVRNRDGIELRDGASPEFSLIAEQNGRKFLDEVEGFFFGLAQNVDDLRRACEESAMEAGGIETVLEKTCRLTPSQAEIMVKDALRRYSRAMLPPGEAVGAIGAQSMGEPSTQMTLKTFHFAGVASMNVTLGVPRIKEIINASKEISTPIITAALVNEGNEQSAKMVRSEVQGRRLGDIVYSINEEYSPSCCHLVIQLNMKAIEHSMLDIDPETVRNALIKGKGAKTQSMIKDLKKEHIMWDPRDHSRIIISPPHGKKSCKLDPRTQQFFNMQQLKTELPDFRVHGINSVTRAVISRKEGKSKKSSKSATPLTGNAAQQKVVLETLGHDIELYTPPASKADGSGSSGVAVFVRDGARGWVPGTVDPASGFLDDGGTVVQLAAADPTAAAGDGDTDMTTTTEAQPTLLTVPKVLTFLTN
jgi:DNA-directed RNA polymerase III subunit RPC1